MLTLSNGFLRDYPRTGIGILSIGGVTNPRECPALERIKNGLEDDLRGGYEDKAAIRAEPVIGIYRDYYKRFKSTYHVLNQVASVALKGRSIPRVASLVEAMFMAELKNMVLTSGHDAGSLKPPLRMDAARGGETFIRPTGKEARVRPGDILLLDADGPVGSIIHGPDRKTLIRPETTEVLFVAWGVPGLDRETIRAHLGDIESYIKTIAPDCRVEESRVLPD